MSNISFNFTDLKDIRPALSSLRCGIGKRDCAITRKHVAPLDDLAARLHVTPHARQNAKRLATGYRNLVVLLLEPSDNAEDVSYQEMLESSTALQYVDGSLRLAFNGRRNLDNTVVLDIRPYRSSRIRMQQEEEERIADDEQAYAATEEILTLLRPDLVLICQCQTSHVINRFAAGYCSSVESSGDLYLSVLQSGHKIVKINSFHPMYFARTDKDKEPLERIMREYLFDTTFLVAANFLAGRRLSGFGMDNLRKCALHGRVMKFTTEGVRITYQWTDEDDIASPDLIQKLEGLGLGATDSRSAELDQLLSINLRKHKEYDGFVSISDGSGSEKLKEDVFEEIGHLVPKLSTELVPMDDIRVDLSPPKVFEYPNRTVVTRKVLFSCPLVQEDS